MDSPTRFLRATPVIKVSDYPASRQFYEDVLGFEVCEEGGDPPRFGIFERGRSVVFVDSWHGGPAGSDVGWVAYLHVAGLDRLFQEFERAGARITRPITQTVYGMREFDVADPDGNILCFGEDSEGTN